jgi:hypothetical protein
MVGPQTTIQILRCLTLGGYTARVENGRLKTKGPQPLAGPLPASIKARRDELVEFLTRRCGGVWPPAQASELGEVAEFLECTPSFVLNVGEAAQRRQAA